MAFIDEDKILIKKKFVLEGIHSKEVGRWISLQKLAKRGVNKLLKSCRTQAQLTGGQAAPDRLVCRTEENVETVNNFRLESRGQATDPYDCPWDIRGTGIHRSSVPQIICKDLHLKCFVHRSWQTRAALLAWSALTFCFKFPQYATDFVFFTDKKMFSVTSPDNR